MKALIPFFISISLFYIAWQEIYFLFLLLAIVFFLVFFFIQFQIYKSLLIFLISLTIGLSVSELCLQLFYDDSKISVEYKKIIKKQNLFKV